MAELTRETIGQILSLIVHDLRNPTATLSANLAFIRDVAEGELGPLSEDVLEALQDAGIALADLMRGLDQFAWVARWLAGEPAVHAVEADAVPELKAAAERHKHVRVSVELQEQDKPLRVRGGSVLAKLLDTLLSNSVQHAGHAPIVLRAARQGERVIIEVRDQGRAIASELRDKAFSLEGQWLLKGRSDGRYGRVVALFAVATLAEAIGAKLEADGTDGESILRLSLQAI
jgi:signal transduction histidine kinase